MKLISNRKLYRLGVGVALLMTSFLVYLVYNDVSYTAAQVDDVSSIKGRLVGGVRDSDESPEAYVRRELANQILPFADDLTTPRWSHLESPAASNSPNENNFNFNMISTGLDQKEMTEQFESKMDVNIDRADEILLSNNDNNNVYFKFPFPPPEQKYNDVSLLKHSNQNKKPLSHKIPSYLNNDTIGKNINSFSTNNKNNNINPFTRLTSYLGNGNAFPHFYKSFTQLPSNRYNQAVEIGQNNNIIIKSLEQRQYGIKSSVKSSGTKNGKKYLVYLCNSVGLCGGWGDRQRGIASSYHFAKLIGREFRIVMNTPCNLTKFLRPYKLNWELRPDEIGPSARKVILNSISKLHFRDKLKEGDFNVRYPHDVIFIKTNQDLIKGAEWNPLYSERIKRDKDMASKKSRLRSAWRDLMQPTDFILAHLQALLSPDRLIRRGLLSKPLGNSHEFNKTEYSVKSNVLSSSSSLSKPLICAHVRMGKNPTIPMDEQFDSISPRDIPKLLRFLQSLDTQNNAQFFLATDFEAIRYSFLQFFDDRLLRHSGKIIHIDRQRSTMDACEGFGVAIVDQLVLSLCDRLVVSRSGFSIHASYVSNSSLPVYIMEGGVIRVFVE